jgi:hypothetical protein
MRASISGGEIDLRRLYWVGPATVAASVAVVWLLQVMTLSILVPPRRSLLRTDEPVLFTAILVTIAVAVFAMVGGVSSTPRRTFRRIALAALIVSCVPDVALGFGLVAPAGWSVAIIFILMHIAAWAVTVAMLTGLTTSRR